MPSAIRAVPRRETGCATCRARPAAAWPGVGPTSDAPWPRSRPGPPAVAPPTATARVALQLDDQLVGAGDHCVGAPEVVAQHVERAVEVELRCRWCRGASVVRGGS